VGDDFHRARLALDARPARQPVVPNPSRVPPNDPRRLGRRDRKYTPRIAGVRDIEDLPRLAAVSEAKFGLTTEARRHGERTAGSTLLSGQRIVFDDSVGSAVSLRSFHCDMGVSPMPEAHGFASHIRHSLRRLHGQDARVTIKSQIHGRPFEINLAKWQDHPLATSPGRPTAAISKRRTATKERKIHKSDSFAPFSFFRGHALFRNLTVRKCSSRATSAKPGTYDAETTIVFDIATVSEPSVAFRV